MTKLQDGTGSGKEARVNKQNELAVAAVVQTELEHASEDSQLSFSWASGTYNPDALDTILLVKNTSDRDLHISTIWISTDTDTRVVIHIPTSEVTPAGTTVSGVNLNSRGSTPEADAKRDETANTQGSIIWSGEIMAASNPYPVRLEGAVILAKNESIGVDYVSAVTAVDVTIIGHYSEDS